MSEERTVFEETVELNNGAKLEPTGEDFRITAGLLLRGVREVIGRIRFVRYGNTSVDGIQAVVVGSRGKRVKLTETLQPGSTTGVAEILDVELVEDQQ
ncbi:MAG: hypothetical protein UU93_C0002G0011 [Candidatus Amesbacteria bacterium GW2011_GWA2_42_12]|uniref:Uncharacterized protein n=1 Tax=Candidatus Amesbacteria bacterium GW2011_GWA2_42_12 TaxID=1618356 RepID=A0A0G1B6C1_9BACT|nr:MAG: hypothetical protein UU93_C0002G0011 [Candidatus Amesbacteria bacterium GW2011_GWA2_42_12]